MTRLITKQMRDSFNISAGTRIRKWMSASREDRPTFKAVDYFNSTKKQRILILKRTVK